VRFNPVPRLRLPAIHQSRSQNADDHTELRFIEARRPNWGNACSPHSSPWRDRFRQMESPLARVIDMHAAAVLPKQVKLGTHRAALRMWIPEDDSE
jgi:hypothetical protein